ncbi:hypothetical protein ACBP93_10370, partial [Paenalcaligenes hominis]|uniref:hypothetical protein n=1 Tax=Paenalcaligenes hominis TaxID=643674 RepID=UPI00352594FE
MHRILQVGLVPKDNLEQWLKQEEIQHITVLEPHPQLVQQLQQQYSGQAKLQVVAAALSPNPGLQTLIDYSLPGFSSLSPATGLKRLFPGLQDTQHLEVNALSPTHFLEQYGPESGQTATLVIHAKGYEAELIQELIRSPALLRFTDVLLYSAADSLYEHSADTAILQKQLIEAGYELLQEQVVSPEWTESYFKRNAVQDEIVLLRQQLKNKEQLEVALAQSQSEIQALQQAVVAEKSVANQHAQQAQKLQAVLENVKKEFNVFQAQLTTKENDQQKQRQQFQAALAAAESERQKAVALSEQLAADLQQTKQANQAAEIAREQLQSELQALQKAVTTEK